MAKCVCGSNMHESVTCPQCGGAGRKAGSSCSHCRGTGKKCPKGKG